MCHSHLVGKLEELKDIVVCLCRGDYLKALQQKTPQHLLHTVATTAGEVMLATAVST